MRRRTDFAVWLGLVLAGGLLMFTYHHLGEIVNGGGRPAIQPFIDETVSILVHGLLFFGVRRMARAWPLTAWPRLAGYLVAVLAYSAVHTTGIWGLRIVLYRLAGFDGYHYGAMPLRYAMELPADVILFAVMVAGVHAATRLGQARERELRLARLEATFAQTQLHNLRLQLQPHFLFNTLHAVSSTMYDDPAAADEVLDSLGELLRASLRGSADDELPLRGELALLERYLGIMRARFGDRLDVAIDAEPATLEGRVPFMCIQPLVENAVRHGSIETSGRGRVVVRSRLDGDALVIEVDDDGPGVPAGRDALSAGFGLSSTAERMRLLYGAAAAVTADNLPGGGFRVRARLPFRAADKAAA